MSETQNEMALRILMSTSVSTLLHTSCVQSHPTKRCCKVSTCTRQKVHLLSLAAFYVEFCTEILSFLPHVLPSPTNTLYAFHESSLLSNMVPYVFWDVGQLIDELRLM